MAPSVRVLVTQICISNADYRKQRCGSDRQPDCDPSQTLLERKLHLARRFHGRSIRVSQYVKRVPGPTINANRKRNAFRSDQVSRKRQKPRRGFTATARGWAVAPPNPWLRDARRPNSGRVPLRQAHAADHACWTGGTGTYPRGRRAALGRAFYAESVVQRRPGLPTIGRQPWAALHNPCRGRQVLTAI